jgi:hypothetical protein
MEVNPPGETAKSKGGTVPVLRLPIQVQTFYVADQEASLGWAKLVHVASEIAKKRHGCAALLLRVGVMP